MTEFLATESSAIDSLARDGIAVVPSGLPSSVLDALVEELAVSEGRGGDRTLFTNATIRNLAVSSELARLAERVLGPEARVARVIFFDKRADANWKVPYHQDLTIAVRERHDVPGYTAWSRKAEIDHVQPPAEVLEKMVAVRLHLDPCGMENGPLRAIPGTHLQGRFSAAELDSIVANSEEVTYTAERGEVILMRPLTLHASSPAESPSHRRVLHIEYASMDLPKPLEWHLGWPLR